MPIFNGTNNIANIYKGNTQITKVYQGTNLKYELSLLSKYELLADLDLSNGTSNPTITGLNIGVNDKLRLVLSSVDSSSTSPLQLSINGNTSFDGQGFFASGTTLPNNTRTDVFMGSSRAGRDAAAFVDIDIDSVSNFVVVNSETFVFVGNDASALEVYSHISHSNFTTTTITSVGVIGAHDSGSRIQLYKVVQ